MSNPFKILFSRRSILPLTFGLVFAAGAGSAVAQGAAWDPAIARFDSQIATDVEADGVGGITAAVVVGEEVVWAKGYGWADVQLGVPATVSTIYRTGSISKSFTALAMMILADQGVLSPDDPVERYLPQVNGLQDRPDSAPSITLRRLASHTAGIIREPELEDAASGPIETWEEKILASIGTTRFIDMPGAKYSYSNIGYGTLGLAISRAAGQPFMDLVTRKIFEPLEMTSSTFIITPTLNRRLATGYANGRDGEVNTAWPAIEHAGRGYKVPNGGIYSTVGDLARFVAVMTGAARPPLIRPETRAEMLTVQTPESEYNGYGLGFSIRTIATGDQVMGHGGSVAGYTAYIVFHPPSQTGVIILRNYNRGATNLGAAGTDLLAELINLLEG
jgi:CubicO group peptidase (beta-lactamase class C family)